MKHFSLIGLFLVAAAHAQQPERELEFRLLDLNGDGEVSLAEAAGNAEIVTKFERADRDRSGKLTFKEFERLKKLKNRVAVKPREPSSAAGGSRPR